MNFKSFLLLLLCAFPLFALDKVSVQLKWHHQFQFAGYYAAVEQGYYRDEGLDVSLKDRNPAINNIEQVLNGESQYGIGDSALLVYRAQKKPIVIVAPIFQHSPYVLIALKSSGIDSPYKMIGKRISMPPNDADGLPYLAMLYQAGVTKNGFHRVETKFDINDLTSKEVDVHYGYATNEPFEIRKKGFEVNIIEPQHFGVNFYGDMLFTTQDELTHNPKRVEAMKRATIKGWEYAIAHKEEMIRLIQTKYGNTQTTEKLMFEANGIIAAIAPESLAIGTFDQGRLDYMQEMLENHGLLNPDESWGQSVYRDVRGMRQKILEQISLDSIVYISSFVFILLIILIYFMRKLQINKEKLTALNAQTKTDKQRLYAIIEASPIPLAVNNDQQQIIYINKSFTHTFGYTLEDIPTLSDWWPKAYPDPDYREWVATTWQTNLEKAKRNNKPFKPLEINIQCKDKTIKTTICSASSIDDMSDGIHLVTLYDITERKLYEDSETKYKSLIENTPGIAYRCRFDKDWTMLFMSKEVDAVTGYSSDELVGGNVTYGALILPEDSAYVEESVAKAIEKNEAWEIEYRIKNKDGSIKNVYEKGRAVFDHNGDIEYLDGFLLDITERKKTEIALREKNVFISGLIENANSVIFVKDLDGRYLLVNRHYEKSTGITREELLGKTDADIFPSEITKSFRESDLKVINSGQVQENEVALETSNGIRHFLSVKFPLKDETNEVVFGICGISYDITDRKNAEAALHSALSIQKAIFDNAGSAIITTDIEGLITSYNKAAEVMLGYSREEMVDKQSPAILFRPEEITKRAQEFSQELGEVVEPGFKVFAIKADYNLKNIHEWTYVRKDGSEIPAVLNVTAMRNINGDTFGYLGIATDITLFKEAEAKIIQAKEAAEASARAKSEFLAAMSHEIRTPMNGVLGMLGLLDNTQLDPSQKREVAIAISSATSLLGLINDILDFSKIEAGKMDLEMLEFDLKQELESFVESIGFKAEEKGLKLILNTDEITHPNIISDPGRLRQILTNFMGNAVKFTHEGQITIIASLQQENETYGHLHIDVVDTGIGIPPEKIETLFEAFTQADGSTTRKYGGTGLGLSIVKKLCELMDGSISATSTPGVGSTFSVDLHVELGSDQITIQTIEEETNEENIVWPPNTRILLVEDNIVNQLVAEGILEHIGLDCDIAANGLEALEAIRISNDTQTYTLVLMDCQMPEMDGYDATRAVRDGKVGEENKQLPIIAMTANAMQGDHEKCTLAGMDDYITKPISSSVLKSTLIKWILNDKTYEPSNNEISATEQTTPTNLSLRDETDAAPRLNIHLAKEGSTDEIVIDGVDMACLQKEFKPQSIESFLRTFANSQRDTCDKLQKVEIFSDEFKTIIHTLKGVSGNLSISKIYELTINIEQSKNQEAVLKIVSQLYHEMQLTIASINRSFPPEEVEVISSSREETLELIDNVLDILKSNSLIDEKILNTFVGTIKPITSYGMSKQILNAIDEFDFKTAITLIETIKEAYYEQ